MSDAQVPSPSPLPSNSKEKIFTNIEAGLLGFLLPLILISVILLGLNYFNILPVSKVFPFLSFLPTKEKGLTGKNYTGVDPNLPAQTSIPEKIDYDPNAKPSVEAVSDISGYTLTLQNKDKLIELLNSWGVFDKNYDSRYGAEGSTKGYPLKTITARLTNIDQRTNAYARTPDDIYTSSIIEITPGKADVIVFVEDKILENKDENYKANSVFGVSFFTSIYRFVNPVIGQEQSEERDKKMFELFRTDDRLKQDYFNIVKL